VWNHSIAAAVERNFERSRLGFFPCEPGWSFTVCNTMGAQTLFGHDTLHGTASWKKIKPRWVQTLDDEYSSPDGSYAHIRSNLVGLSWDTGEVPGGHYLAAGSNRFADILPEHAERADALERRKAATKIHALAASVVDGRLDLELPAQLDRHRARRSSLGGWNGVIGGARLVGENGLAIAAMDAAARQCATGSRWPDRPLDAGVPAIGGHMMLRWSYPLGTADLNRRGHVPPAGPCLDAAGWDLALVTEARSPDGVHLRLRVEPLDHPLDAIALTFSNLRSHTTYALSGTDSPGRFTADGVGRGSITIALRGPLQLTLTPEEPAP
jgi:hypothetical protein